ncbi:hypothetical protein FRC07_007902 [Ceratobasidium sp. 392]|nr:hypothetical protein FRC07_007902 [Ceratobasidium sp. 392]
MFALPRHLCAPSYQPYYNPYEQLLLEQEMERRQRVELFRRQQEVEQINRRRQYEHALRQAELQRQRQMEIERESKRRAMAEQASERRRSMMSGGMEDLFEMLYGSRVKSTSTRDRHLPFWEHRASPEPVSQSEKTDGTVEQSGRANPDTRLPNETTELAETSSATAAVEREAEAAETDETQQYDTSESHAAVAGILTMFASLRSGFSFPSRLDFAPSSSSDPSKLAYTPNNAPIHQYEHVLTGLLTQLDAVESYGDEEVRRARRDAVKQIEKELAGLDERKMEEWRKQNAIETETKVELEMTHIDSDTPAVEIDAAKVPLPDDADDEVEMADCEPQTEPLPSAHTPTSNVSMSAEGLEINQTSLGEASGSDDDESEVEDYVDVETDVMSGTEMEEVEVEEEKDTVRLDEWELDF